MKSKKCCSKQAALDTVQRPRDMLDASNERKIGEHKTPSSHAMAP